MAIAQPPRVRVSYPGAIAFAPIQEMRGPVPREQLGKRIEELLDELEKVEPADPTARDRLAHVLRDMRSMVAESELESEQHESLRERFDEAARHFEESHPTLTAVVGRVADSLANLGI